MNSFEINNREYQYEVVPPTIKHERDRKKAHSRVLVTGWNRADGKPIRFHSKDAAERHIRNMTRG